MAYATTPTDLDILVVTFFTWSLNVRFSSSVMPRNLTVETFVRIEISIAFFWLEIIIYEVLLERKSVGLEPIINTYQLPIHSGMDIVNVTVECKNCCIISKMNKTHLILGSIHVIDIPKKEY